jgi:TPR repeat protein
MAGRTNGEQHFRWAEKSAAQEERDSFCHLGYCYRDGIGCEEEAERAKENFLVAAELGHVEAMVCVGRLLDKDDPRRFVWLARAAAGKGYSESFLNEMWDQIYDFNRKAEDAKVVFAIGRALKGHIDNKKRTIFDEGHDFKTYIGPANQALYFYEFQLMLSKSS